MPEATRPDEGYPEWGTDVAAVITTPNAGLRENGWINLQVADEGQFNWQQNKNGGWIRRLDQASLGPEIMGSSSWYTARFGFDTGAGLTQTFNAGVIWIDSLRLQFDDDYLSEVGESDHTFAASVTTTMSVSAERLIDYRVGGAAPAGYTDVQDIVTDGAGVTAVNPIVQSAVTDGSVIGSAVRFDGGSVALDKTDAETAELAFTVAGVNRWRWAHLGNEDLRLERFDAAGVSQRSELGFAVGGGVTLNGRPDQIANAPAGADSVTVGQLSEDHGFTVMFDTTGTIAFCRVANTAAASLSMNSSDVLSLTAGSSTIEIDDASGTVQPSADDTLIFGSSTRRWQEAHAATYYATRLRGPTDNTLRIGDVDSSGDVAIEGDGSTPSTAPFLRIQNHQGMAGGAFDANSLKIAVRAGQTNTNGTVDIVLIGGSDVSPSRAYYMDFRILGVEDLDATDGYARRNALVYINTDSTAIAFATTVEDTGAAGGYGGWAAACTAGISIDGSNNIVLRVTAPDTVVRNWTVVVQMHDCDHAD